MTKIIEGCWDCRYCGTKQIGGSHRNCPNCGRPRDKDVVFYMGEAIHYVEDPDKINQNPDWICSFCDALNSDSDEFCSGCGASREDSERNYFEQRRLEEEKNKPKVEQPVRHGSRLIPLIGLAILVFIASMFMGGSQPRTMTFTNKLWERARVIEVYRAVQESDWSAPSDAYNITTRSEPYSYNTVLDHYVTRYRTVSHQVFDGYDTYTTYEDMGNGYFKEVQHSTPRYRTEYSKEAYQEPVYIQIPVFRTKYYYTIDKWVVDRTERTSGDRTTEPYYKTIKLGGEERLGEERESYALVVKKRSYQTTYDIYQEAEIGRKYKVTFKNGYITALE